eukprot:962302-Pyramimonas_sp.AAC.1
MLNFHTSPGPSRHLEPLLDLRADPVSDRIMIDASPKPILDSDDECKDGKRLIQDECSSAQPMIMSAPDAMRSVRSAREISGATPHPLTKKPKSDNGDLDVSPLSRVFYMPDFLSLIHISEPTRPEPI